MVFAVYTIIQSAKTNKLSLPYWLDYLVFRLYLNENKNKTQDTRTRTRNLNFKDKKKKVQSFYSIEKREENLKKVKNSFYFFNEINTNTQSWCFLQ